MKFIITSILALTVFLTTGFARAVESLSTQELVEHCSKYTQDPVGKDAIFCIRYIQGFIDGALATDERVTMNVSAENSGEETFSERAMRTRVGNRIKRYGPTYYADFCLGAPVQLKEIVNKVVNDLNNPEVVAGELLARNAVYQTLRKDYACVKDVND